MANRLAKVLSSLTKASNKRLDQVISGLEDQTIKSGESSSLGRPSRKGKAAAKQKMYCVSNPHKELLYGPFQLIRMHSCNTLRLDI